MCISAVIKLILNTCGPISDEIGHVQGGRAGCRLVIPYQRHGLQEVNGTLDTGGKFRSEGARDNKGHFENCCDHPVPSGSLNT